MSDPRIRAALEAHLAALPADPLPTAWQNWSDPDNPIPPVDGGPHQEAFILPADNSGENLKNTTTLHKGIFQVNLCYPAGVGTSAVEQRALLLQNHFNAAGPKLEGAGIAVRITKKPSIARPMDRPGLYVVPVSIPYESIF